MTTMRLPYLRKVPAHELGEAATTSEIWQEITRRSVQPVTNLPQYRAREFFSLHHSMVDFRRMRKTFDAADVVHLHWTVGTFDYVHAGEVLGDKPIVWTLADMNAFTGGCHYSEGCEGFKRDCRDCPLTGDTQQLAHETWKVKQATYSKLRRLHVICPSKWLADLARKSSLFGGRPIHHIPNAFPVDQFVPTNKIVARIRLGLPVDRKLLLFGAENLGNARKGGRHLRQAIEILLKHNHLDGVDVVVFGNQSIELPVGVHRLGKITDNERLALAYSAADGFIFPSIEDNAPLTVGESLLCGTPVVAFPVGNVPELIRHQDTGYIAQHLNTDDLAVGIRWILEQEPRASIQRSLRCRVSSAKFHDPALAVARHVKVYEEAMHHD